MQPLKPGVERLSGRLDSLAKRVGHLQAQLASETAATKLARWVSRHPPASDFRRQIGDGNTGSVHEVALAHQPHTLIAVKRVDWSTHEQRSSVAKRVATEISVLQSLQHPLLPTLHQVYTTGDELCMEMTLCSRGTLWHERLALGGTMPLELVRQYAAELVCVLSHLHEHGVVYVDLKPENVLLQDCGHIMLCDMDLAHTMQEIEQLQQLAKVGGGSGGFWGTVEYVAPEVATYGCVAYAPASDWWGLGVLMYELLLGLAPWDAEEYDDMLAQIRAGDVVWPPAGVLDAEAEDLIRGLLEFDPKRRLGAKGAFQLQRHPFFASVGWGSLVAEVEQAQRAHALLAARQRAAEAAQQDGGAAGSSSGGSSSSRGGGGNGYSRMADANGAGSHAPAFDSSSSSSSSSNGSSRQAYVWKRYQPQ